MNTSMPDVYPSCRDSLSEIRILSEILLFGSVDSKMTCIATEPPPSRDTSLSPCTAKPLTPDIVGGLAFLAPSFTVSSSDGLCSLFAES